MTSTNNSFYKNKRIAVISTKGGVGKTTDCLHIGYKLEKKYNLKFQYVDSDAQESGTNHCEGRANLLSDCLGLTNSNRSRPIPDDVKKLVKRLYKDTTPYVMPNIIKKGGFSQHYKEAGEHYDGFITDTQGADSTVCREVMLNSDILIVPVNASGLVLAELKKLIDIVIVAKQYNTELRVFIVFNRVVATATKIAREHIKFVNEMIEEYFAKSESFTKEQAMIQVCETVITERQDIYNNVDIGLNAFELSKGKTVDAEIQFDTLLDEIEYLYGLTLEIKEVA